jgi:hypothetical protein
MSYFSPLFRRRSCPVPTWRAWLLLAIAALLASWITRHALYPFLAVTEPLPGGTLIVEGWAGDATLHRALAEMRSGHFSRCFVTGGPLELGAPLSEHKTFAELGGATLLRIGIPSNQLVAVPSPAVKRDRTLAAAQTLREWLDAHSDTETNFTLMTGSVHARRSWLLFEDALKPQRRVGVIAAPPMDFDPQDWWRTSQGFRTVTSEALAYVYARFLR